VCPRRHFDGYQRIDGIEAADFNQGVCVAFIVIIADRLIGAWARRWKQELGLE